jgi:hypothetical protein
MWMDYYGRDGDVLGSMLMLTKVGLCRGVTQGGNNKGDDDMACVRETERFSRFAVRRTRKLCPTCLLRARGVHVRLTINKEKRDACEGDREGLDSACGTNYNYINVYM